MKIDFLNFNLHIEKAEEKGRFRAILRDDRKNELASHAFDYRIDTYVLSRLEESVGRNIPENERLIRKFGSGLFNTIFTGEIRGRYDAAIGQDKPVRIRLFFKKDEPALLRIPWEFLYDGQIFLAAREGLTLSRVIDGIASNPKKEITGPLRILAVVSSPLNLKDHERLQIEKEQMLLLEALDRPYAANKIEIDFEDEASMRNIQDRLEEEEYYILHYTGHGVYSDTEDRGYLLLEDESGEGKPVENERFAELLSGYPSLRCVVLSGCQTAKTKGLGGLRDLATPLLNRGIPAVVAMNYSVVDSSAIDLARKFYTELSDGIPLDLALTRARKELLLTEGTGKIDFATPVLYADDPDCLVLAGEKLAAAQPGNIPLPQISIKKNLSLTLEQLGRQFIGRRGELRRIKDDFFNKGIRAVVLHGIGGIGKTVTATKIAERLEKFFHGIYAFDCRGGLKIEEVLMQSNAFLVRNGVNALENVVSSQDPLDVKVGYLAQVLSQVKLLLIFDNVETLLSEEKNRWEFTDAELKKGLRTLVNQCKDGTRFLFTSRYTFNLTDGRLTNEIDEINLGELSRPEALMVMNRFPDLARESIGTKLAVYEKIGGQPYTINIFGKLAREKSVQDILADIAGVNREMVEFTLLDRSYEKLSLGAREVINRASVFRKAIPYACLEWILKDTGETPDLRESISELIHWGLIIKIDEDGVTLYQVHAIVRDFVAEKIGDKKRKEWLVKGAVYYENLVDSTRSVWDYLEARNLYFEAGEYDKAGEIVSNVMEHLDRQGFIDLVRKLNEETIETASGRAKAAALHHLGMIHQSQGEYDKSIEKYNQSLKIKEELGDKSGIAATLHQLGIIHQDQGDYDKAIEKYNQSLKITEELGDKSSIAQTLHQLGNILYLRSDYNKAIEKYNQSLKIKEELGDKRGIAATLHNLGAIHQRQGEYDKAIEKYNQSLKIEEELGNKSGIAITLHQLGMIHQDQGDYDKAIEKYNQSLKIEEELGDKHGIAQSLHQLAMILVEQGEYDKAIEKYNQSLKIKEDLGNKGGIAATLHNLGMIHQAQGDYDKAIEKYNQSLRIAEELGDKSSIAISIGQLGRIDEIQEKYKDALQKYLVAFNIFDELKSPYKDTVESWIAGLKDKIGEDKLRQYFDELTKENPERHNE